MSTYLNRSTLLDTQEATALREQIRQYFHQTADLLNKQGQAIRFNESAFTQ
jgi:hypothetical protein